jgi:hypothetical protein
MQKVLMILGMHRSGTSLVTQWLFRCGLHVGTRLLAGGIGNVEGHFEDEDFYNLHCEWLTKRQLTHTGLIDHSPVLTDEEVQQVQTLLVQKHAERNQWSWKEPRTCLWLSVYNRLLPDAYSFVVVRSFNDTVNSLVMREYRMEDRVHQQKVQRKKGIHRLKWKYLKAKRPKYYFRLYAEEYLGVWVHYYEQIVAHYESLPTSQRLLVSYEELLQDDTAVSNYLTHEWGFSLQPIPFKEVFKKELLSQTRNIARYVKNKELLARARQLEAHCAALSRANKHSQETAVKLPTGSKNV